jgi:RimJ/RimL family protein N-acetyltransferase
MTQRVTLRPVREEDSGLLFEWRNDADAIRLSGTGRPVTREDHETWFAARLADPRGYLWIAEETGNPVAQVRVDVNGRMGVVSIAVDAAYRGRGFGTEVLRQMVSEMADQTRVILLCALVHPDNGPSVRAFEKAGFRLRPAMQDGFKVLEWRVHASRIGE